MKGAIIGFIITALILISMGVNHNRKSLDKILDTQLLILDTQLLIIKKLNDNHEVKDD